MATGHVVPPLKPEIMRFFSTIADTIAQRLMSSPVKPDNSFKLEHIRQEMLQMLPAKGHCIESDRVRTRILVAADAKSLWFLRTTLHQQLSKVWGEQLAMQKVHSLWPLFAGCISPSLLGKQPITVNHCAELVPGNSLTSKAKGVFSSMQSC